MLPGFDLLVKRVAEYKIPPWRGTVNFERVLVYRIPDEASSRETFAKDGVIVKPDDVRDLHKWRSPMGVIVSAGLRALDILYDHGMTIGELVWISPTVLNRFEVDRDAEGKSLEFYFMNVDDVIVSMDLDGRIASGELAIVRNDKGQHVFVRKNAQAPAERNDTTVFADTI